MPTWNSINQGVIEIKNDDARADWEQWVLLLSDNHHDSPYCDRKLEKKHLDLALERDALILFGGDVFDAMGGRYDPRRSAEGVRPEDNQSDYLDQIVKHAAEDYGPYAKNIVMVGMGNHEAGILQHNNTNLTSSLVHDLNSDYKGRVIPASMEGWVLFRFKIRKTIRRTIYLYWHHGADGASPVTRGMISTARQAVYLPDANIVWNGHNHQDYYTGTSRRRCNHNGVTTFDVQHFIRTPGYKDELGKPAHMAPGYAERKQFAPTPRGCAWLRFTNDDDDIVVSVMVDVS